jgi:hypothetical protein
MQTSTEVPSTCQDKEGKKKIEISTITDIRVFHRSVANLVQGVDVFFENMTSIFSSTPSTCQKT